MREIASRQYTFERTHNTAEAQQLILGSEVGDSSVGITGRLLSVREQGEITFADLHDEEGRLQVVASADITPEYEKFHRLSVGDWVGVSGPLGKTKRGEPSLFIDNWARMAATERPFPDKQHGLQDQDTINRQRYLDLAVNPDSMRRFRQRSRIVSGIRKLLEDQDFIEVETPILQSIYGGAAAKPFETHHNALDMELYLRVAPELYLKRLVVGGMQRVFEMGKVFRNEGVSTRHNPEFTMMEVYSAFWDYKDQMRLTENMVASLSEMVNARTDITYQGRAVDLSTPWHEATMDSLISEAVGEPVSMDTGLARLRQLCTDYEIPFEKEYGEGKLLLELYEKLVESTLWGPIFVTDYPEEVSPLARSHRSRPGYTERFEGIVAGRELCNGYTELNDPHIQYDRFKDQEDSSAYDDEAMHMDYDYIRALQYGMPPTAGMGIGIDRLVMLLTDSASIKDVILFPTQRPDDFTTAY